MAEGRAADPGMASFQRAVALIDGMTSAGLAHVVVSPGSRSTPLALAAARALDLRVHTVADERAAAFFALGLARATGRPALVVATSGSAPAHWLPAVIEACEDDQPVLLASADRPPELLGCGANQATDQTRLFGTHARAALALPAEATPDHAMDVGRRAGLACRWPRPGPVHVNVAFREPMTPADPGGCRPWRRSSAPMDLPVPAAASPEAVQAVLEDMDGRRGAILAGRMPPGSGAAAGVAALAAALDCPVIADPLSGLRAGERGGARILAHADAFLRADDAPDAEWLLRVGAPPVSRHVEAWAGRCPRTSLVAAHAAWPDPDRTAARILPGDPAATLAALAAEAGRAGVRAAGWPALDTLEAGREAALQNFDGLPGEAALMGAIAAAAPPGTPVFLGNSLVVRDADTFLPRRPDPLSVFGNRGVSGIDGNVATAAGIAAGSGRPGLAVVGDVTLFHDLNSLALAARHSLVVVVVNNGGGAIFGQLEQARLPEFETLWLTPPGLDMEAAARLFGLPFRRLDPGADPARALSEALGSGSGALLEFVVDREASAAGRARWWRPLA